MTNQECVYRERTSESVYFGVGSFGTQAENTMGKCYRMEVSGMDAPVIAQVVNTGSDVHTGQFDLQQMAGGIGLCNALTAHTDGFSDGETSGDALYPMFAGDNTVWGPLKYGGFQDRSGCAAIPEYPDAVSSSPFSNNEMDLRTMCRRAFEIGARVDSGANPTVTTGQRVACPPELYKVTGLRLLSDDTFTDNEAFTNGGVTRMFDGCKPSSGWTGNVVGADPSSPATIGCGRDGIERVTVSGYSGGELTMCSSSTPTPSPATTSAPSTDATTSAPSTDATTSAPSTDTTNNPSDGESSESSSVAVYVGVSAAILVAVIGTVLTFMCYRSNRASTGQLRAPKHVLGDIEVGSTTDEL